MTIKAKYTATCSTCHGRIAVGQEIEWVRGSPVQHTSCARITPRPLAGVIQLSGGSGYNCHGWQPGQVILSGHERRRSGGPDGLVILTADRRYVRDDGLSVGVGDDTGYIYTATARAATAAEMVPAIETVHAEALAIERDRARRLNGETP